MTHRPSFEGLVPLAIASVVLLVPSTIDYSIEGGDIVGLPYPIWLAFAYVANFVLTVASPRYKRRVVATFQRYVLNPPVRLMLRLGLPLGWCLLETHGHKTGKTRVVPVGNGLVGDTLWVVAEHGDRAGYVRNIRHHDSVRVYIRDGGLRMRWLTGTAVVLDDDDPYARQRLIGGWRHPVRALNAMVVRVMGTQLRTVRIDLDR